MANEIYIYEGTTKIGSVPGVDRNAWLAARDLVNLFNHHFGAPARGVWGRTPGRYDYTRGTFRAVNAVRVDS